MERCLWEIPHLARMIKMKMADDDMPHILRSIAQAFNLPRQPLER